MHDLTSFPLDALIRVVKRTNLVDDCRMTEWVVILRIEDVEFVLNHAKAHVFLQGMIRGSLRQQQLSENRLEQSGDGASASWANELHRRQIG